MSTTMSQDFRNIGITDAAAALRQTRYNTTLRTCLSQAVQVLDVASSYSPPVVSLRFAEARELAREANDDFGDLPGALSEACLMLAIEDAQAVLEANLDEVSEDEPRSQAETWLKTTADLLKKAPN